MEKVGQKPDGILQIVGRERKHGKENRMNSEGSGNWR